MSIYQTIDHNLRSKFYISEHCQLDWSTGNQPLHTEYTSTAFLFQSDARHLKRGLTGTSSQTCQSYRSLKNTFQKTLPILLLNLRNWCPQKARRTLKRLR